MATVYIYIYIYRERERDRERERERERTPNGPASDPQGRGSFTVRAKRRRGLGQKGCGLRSLPRDLEQRVRVPKVQVLVATLGPQPRAEMLRLAHGALSGVPLCLLDEGVGRPFK